jgi:hypothetical protein
MNPNCWESTGDDSMLITLTMLPPANISISKNFSIGNIPYLYESESFLLMLASEEVLSKEWDTPEEDKAWESL